MRQNECIFESHVVNKCPSISTPAILSNIGMYVNFRPCHLVRHCPVCQFPHLHFVRQIIVLQFQRSHFNEGLACLTASRQPVQLQHTGMQLSRSRCYNDNTQTVTFRSNVWNMKSLTPINEPLKIVKGNILFVLVSICTRDLVSVSVFGPLVVVSVWDPGLDLGFATPVSVLVVVLRSWSQPHHCLYRLG